MSGSSARGSATCRYFVIFPMPMRGVGRELFSWRELRWPRNPGRSFVGPGPVDIPTPRSRNLPPYGADCAKACMRVAPPAPGLRRDDFWRFVGRSLPMSDGEADAHKERDGMDSVLRWREGVDVPWEGLVERGTALPVPAAPRPTVTRGPGANRRAAGAEGRFFRCRTTRAQF